jgi:hypothetical protein
MKTLKTLSLALAALTMLAGTAHGQTIAGPITNPANGHNYYVIQIANFVDYNTAAGNLNGYPVVINNAAENSWVHANMMPLVPVSAPNAYIGLSDAAREGEWRWEAGVRDTYTNWNVGEPNNSLSSENFAAMLRSNGRWNDIIAPVTGGTLPYAIVEVGGGTVGQPAGVLSGPIADPATGHEYYLVSSARFDAAEAFGVQVLGGNLVSIDSAAENEFIRNNLLTQSNIGGSVWIGLSDQDVPFGAGEGNFRWQNGSTSTYTCWNIGEPNNVGNEDYVAITTLAGSPVLYGGWNDVTNTPRVSIIEVRGCGADYNKSGAVSVQDIFDFLTDWTVGCP